MLITLSSNRKNEVMKVLHPVKKSSCKWDTYFDDDDAVKSCYYEAQLCLWWWIIDHYHHNLQFLEICWTMFDDVDKLVHAYFWEDASIHNLPVAFDSCMHSACYHCLTHDMMVRHTRHHTADSDLVKLISKVLLIASTNNCNYLHRPLRWAGPTPMHLYNRNRGCKAVDTNAHTK